MMRLPFFWPFVVVTACHLKSSLPNENVALPALHVGTAGFGYLLHSHFFSGEGMMRNRTAAVRHERVGCRCIDCEGSCVSYSPGLACACGLTQSPKKSITALAASGGDGAGGGVRVTFPGEIAHE